MVPGFEGSGVFDGGIAVAAKDGFESRAATDGRSRIRLSAGLVSEREKHRVRFVSKRCHRALAAGPGNGKDAAAHKRRGSECGAALVSRWEAHRIRIDFLQQAVSYFPGRCARWTARKCGAADGRNKECASSLLLQRVRHGNQSGVDS